VLLAAILLIPVIAFSGLTLQRFGQRERACLGDTLDSARHLVASVDPELADIERARLVISTAQAN
jgi:hypothetical protein